MSPSQVLVRDEIDERILAAAQSLIATQSYERVRLIDIADEVGVSVGTLQHRFRTRDKLLRATVIYSDELAREKLARSIEGFTDPWDRFSVLLDHIMSESSPESETSYWLQLVAAAARDEELLTLLREQQDSWLSLFRGTLHAGLSSGRMVSSLDEETLATAILAMIDGLFTSRVLGVAYQDLRWARGLLDVIVERLVQRAP